MKLNRSKNIRIVLLTIFLSIVLLYVLVKIIVGISDTREGLSDRLPSIYKLSPEDSSLILQDVTKFKVDEVIRSKTRGNISLLSYDNKYNLLIYKMNVSADTALEHIVNARIKDVDRSTGHTYMIIANNLLYEFQYKVGPVSQISNIYLTLAGDSITTIAKSDSIISFHLRCKNLSLKDNKDTPVDIFVVGREWGLKTIPVSMEIMFLKQRRSLYLLLLTPKKYGSIPRGLLYNILFK